VLVIGELRGRVAQAAQVQVAVQAFALLRAVAQQLGGKPILRAQHVHRRCGGQQLEVGGRHQPRARVVLIERVAAAASRTTSETVAPLRAGSANRRSRVEGPAVGATLAQPPNKTLKPTSIALVCNPRANRISTVFRKAVSGGNANSSCRLWRESVLALEGEAP